MNKAPEMTLNELEEQGVELLPDRELMSTVQVQADVDVDVDVDAQVSAG